MKRPVPTTLGAADTGFESTMSCDECGDCSETLIIKGDAAVLETWLPEVCTFSLEMDMDSKVSDDEAV